MTVIDFPKPNPGNGAREALIRVLDAEVDLNPSAEPGGAALKLPDRLLAALWVEGFKIVPVTDGD